jgi:hypothetical protein
MRAFASAPPDGRHETPKCYYKYPLVRCKDRNGAMLVG